MFFSSFWLVGTARATGNMTVYATFLNGATEERCSDFAARFSPFIGNLLYQPCSEETCRVKNYH